MLYDLKYTETYFMVHNMVFLGEYSMSTRGNCVFFCFGCSVLINVNVSRCGFLKLINYFIRFWLRWVFVAVRGLSLVAASGGYSSLRCAGFSLLWLLLLQSTGSRRVGFGSCGSRALGRRLSSCGARA